MTCTKIDIKAHPRLSRPNKNRNGRIIFPLASLWLLLVPKHCIPRQSRYTSLILCQSTTLQNRFKYSSLPRTPNPALIHACSWTHERAEVVAGATEELGRAELFVGVGPTTDEIARCRVTAVVEVLRGRRSSPRHPLRSLRLGYTATTGLGGRPWTWSYSSVRVARVVGAMLMGFARTKGLMTKGMVDREAVGGVQGVVGL